jgi:hypothetical protein
MSNRATCYAAITFALVLLALALPSVSPAETVAVVPLETTPAVTVAPDATPTTFTVGGVAWLPLVVMPLASPSVPTATATAQPSPTPTYSPPSGPCLCTGNLYNCSRDFATQAEAQACYDHCFKVTGYDIHRLDADEDGKACESLP